MSNDAPLTTQTSAPQVTTETKFMQNYRVASAVNGGSEIVAVCNGSGQVELFTIGTDSMVWNFYPDPSSDTGYSGVSTGLPAAALTAGVNSSGQIVVFAASGLQLYYIVEINQASARWSAPTTVSVPQPLNATKIARVVAQEIAGGLYVGVLTQYNSLSPGNTYALAYTVWQTGAPAFQHTSVNLSSLNCVWLGNTAQSAAFACVDGVIVSYTVATGKISSYPMAASFSSISVDSAVDGVGNNQLFAVLADGNAYRLIGGSNGQAYSWAQLSQGMTLRQIQVDVDQDGSVHPFAVSGDNRLYHWEPDASSTTGYTDPAAIHANVALLSVAGNDSGDIDLFAVGTAQQTLTHLFQEQVSSNWVAQAVEVPTNGNIEEYISYSSDVTVYDAAGALLVNTPVTVWASEESRLTVNGATYFVDPHRPARVATNSAGVLAFAQETGSLAIPTLEINIPSVMTPGATIAIQQSAEVQSRLANVTGTDLLNATDTSGNPLLMSEYRTQETTNSLASAFNQCMALAGTPQNDASDLLRRQGPKPGVWQRAAGDTAALRRIAPLSAEQHWQLSFAGDSVRYRSLTAAEAHALLIEKRATLIAASGIFDWIEDIGDFVEGVIDGIVSIVDTVVTTVSNAVHAAFTFIVDGVTYLFEAVVTLVEQAFDIVEAFFAQVKVIFEKIFEWLGFLFNWNDMLRTHTALAYTINQFLSFLQGAAAGTQTIVDNGINTLQSQLTTLFDQAVQNIAGSSTVGGYDTSNKPDAPGFSSALSNNIVYNGFIDNLGGATSLTAALVQDTDPLTQLMQQITSFVDTTEATAAFTSAVSYFKTLGGSPDQIFTQLLSAMFRVVEGLIQAVLSGVQALVDAMLQLVQTLVATLQSSLNEKWNIPFVSQFYSWITGGSDLTTIDLIALIVAIPTTITYKLIYNAAPFPNDASVTTFENSFNAQSMLQAAGFSTTSPRAQVLTNGGGLLPKEAAMLMATGGFVGSFFYGALTAVLDAIPGSSAPAALSKGAFIMEVCAQVCSFPWFTSSGAPDCSTPDGAARTIWIYQNLGVLLDAVFIAVNGKMPENGEDVGVVIAFVYGACHLPLAIMASAGQSGLPVAGHIIPLIPELAKILRFSGIVEATEGISLAVVAGIDAIFYTTSAIIGFVQSTSTSTTPTLVPVYA